jgi:hypothetical protein
MHPRAVVLHPAVFRPPWHVALVVAAAEVARHLALTFAFVIGGAVAAALVLLLAVVAAPLGAALLTWILWRASRDGARGVRGTLARARRRARALGLRVVEGAGEP